MVPKLFYDSREHESRAIYEYSYRNNHSIELVDLRPWNLSEFQEFGITRTPTLAVENRNILGYSLIKEYFDGK